MPQTFNFQSFPLQLRSYLFQIQLTPAVDTISLHLRTQNKAKLHFPKKIPTGNRKVWLPQDLKLPSPFSLSNCSRASDKWVPVTTAWRILMLQMEERPPIWRVAANILNNQSRTTDKGWSSSLGVGLGANNSSL